MQELEAHLANAQFARRHLSKMAGIGLAALVATLTMPKPVQARHGEDNILTEYGGFNGSVVISSPGAMLRRLGQAMRCLFASRVRRWPPTCRTRICTCRSNTASLRTACWCAPAAL